MSFQIDRHEAIGDGVCRILDRQLERAIGELEQASSESRQRAVHDVRKRIKKIRAILRLLRAITSRGNPKLDNLPLRDAARALAPMRDADVHLATLEKLCEHSGIERARFSRTFQLLERKQSGASARAGEAMRRAGGRLHAMRPNIENWRGDEIGRKDVQRGLRRIYKKARMAFQRAVDDGSVENMHAWRKRTKDVWYALWLFKARCPKPVGKLVRKAKYLSELLGDEHDLAMLRRTLARHRTGAEKGAILKLIASHQFQLQRKAVKAGAKFFAKKPGAFFLRG